MKVQDQPARCKEDETHGQQFWRATQQWGERLRQQKVTLQVVKVAWALERRFSSQHGISYVGRETLANDSGVADVGDVRKALQAMAGARLIEEVAPNDVKNAMRADAARRGGGSRPVGRHPVGYRMVLSASGERFQPSIEALIGRVDDELTPSRIGRSKGATAKDAAHAFRGNRPPEYEMDAESNYRGNSTPITGEPSPRITGEPSPRITGEPSHPKKMEDDVEGGGAPAPFAYIPSSTSEIAEDVRTPGGAPTSAQERSEPVDYDAALQEIIDVYPGPASRSEREYALSAYCRLLDSGAFHEQLLQLAEAHPNEHEELDRFLWGLAKTRWAPAKASA